MIVLELVASDEENYDEIAPFLSAMKKIHEDSKTIGFINRFSKNERILLSGIWEQIKEDAEPVIKRANEKIS